MNKPVSPIRWMVTRDKPYVMSKATPCTIEVVEVGFEKITAAKAFKDSLNEPGLKIIPYYE